MAINSGVSNQVFTGKTPWHGGGTKIDDGLSVVDSISRHAILSSPIDRCPMMFAHYDGQLADADGQFAHIRRADQRLVGYGGPSYVVAQHVELGAFADLVSNTLGATFEIAGTLRRGSQFVLQAKVGNPVVVQQLRDGRADTVQFYLTLGTSHDGEKPTEIGFASYRAECANMTAMAMSETRKGKRGVRYFALRHTSSLSDKLKDAAHALQKGLKAWDDFAEFAQASAITPMTVPAFQDFAAQLIPNESGKSTIAESKRSKLLGLFQNGQGNAGATAWDAYNSVTEWTNYFATVRGADSDAERNESRINSTLYGQSAQLAVEAEQLLRVYVGI